MQTQPLTVFTVPAGSAATCSVCLAVIRGGSAAVADDSGRITCCGCSSKR